MSCRLAAFAFVAAVINCFWRCFRSAAEAEESFVVWPFNDPFHLILNTAVGGNLGGTPSFNSTKTMLVDYVRVYQKTTEQ